MKWSDTILSLTQLGPNLDDIFGDYEPLYEWINEPSWTVLVEDKKDSRLKVFRLKQGYNCNCENCSPLLNKDKAWVLDWLLTNTVSVGRYSDDICLWVDSQLNRGATYDYKQIAMFIKQKTDYYFVH